MKRIHSLWIIAACIFMATSCKKGDTGLTGPQGPKGDAGTANIIYSNWITPQTNTTSTIFGIRHFYYNLSTPQITEQILNTGTVLVYARLEGYTTTIWPKGQVAQLPVTVMFQISGVSNIDNWSAVSTIGKIKIDLVNSGNYYSSIPNTHSFRYIIIPGGMSAAARQSIDFNNYQNTMRYFKIAL